MARFRFTGSHKLHVYDGRLAKGVEIYFNLNNRQGAQFILQLEDGVPDLATISPHYKLRSSERRAWWQVERVEVSLETGKITLFLKGTDMEFEGTFKNIQEFREDYEEWL